MISLTILGIIIIVYFIAVILEITGVMSYEEYISKGWVSAEQVKDGEYYRVITSTFLHANLLHLLVNGYTLFRFRGSEFLFQFVLGSPFLFLLIFILSGIGGSILSILYKSQPSVGASSGIFGLIGSLLVITLVVGLYELSTDILVAIIFNLLLSKFIPDIDIWGHVGGLVTGILFTGILVSIL